MYKKKPRDEKASGGTVQWPLCDFGTKEHEENSKESPFLAAYYQNNRQC
jgi:hypothetical protein